MDANVTFNQNVTQFLRKVKRTTFCSCLDGCQSSKRCACYRWNRKLQNPTYQKSICDKSGTMITNQPRAITSINKVFTFNECHPNCGCNKEVCLNFLCQSHNQKRYKLQITR